jgi:RNA polymerase sigma-70 factor (ECF subfamily)
MEAFKVLFASAEEALYRTGLGLTGSPQDTEEALAETALSVLESLPTLRRPRVFYTWATRIMINACHSLGRQKGKVTPLEGAAPTELQDGAPPFPGNQQWADFQDVRDALAELSDDHRTVVVLRYLEDLPVSEVADILQVPEGTVKSRLHYALRQLRFKLRVSNNGQRAGGALNE